MKSQIIKKWWFWLIVILVTFSIVGKLLGLYDNNPPTANTDSAVNSEEVDTVKKIDNSIDYELVTSEDYGISLKNHKFRVVIDEKATDEQLLWVFNKLNDKKYEEVTAWFYKMKSSIEAGDPYDVAMIKRTGKESPMITR